MLVGLAGFLGSGKDTVYDRANLVNSDIERVAFADKLKDSACALLGMSRDTMEYLKRDEGVRLTWLRVTDEHITEFTPGANPDPPALNMRLFLQRYGTEAHRDIFGTDFWLEQALPYDDYLKLDRDVIVTDVRFPNEIDWVRSCNGRVVWVTGPDDGPSDGHASENSIGPEDCDDILDNSVRGDDYANVDAQIKLVIPQMLGAS